MIKFRPPKPEILNHVVDLVVASSRKAFGEDLVCITLKGSALRGDFIQDFSDFDFDVFLKPEVMDNGRFPKIENAIEFHKSFGKIQPEDYRVSEFQIHFVNSEGYPSDWAPPVKGC